MNKLDHYPRMPKTDEGQIAYLRALGETEEEIAAYMKKYKAAKDMPTIPLVASAQANVASVAKETLQGKAPMQGTVPEEGQSTVA